ncbi:MAG: PAS domain S-box protein [Euryarchaeota archaeon]|nr:PAS domain S-box protein [Euryarchaeota archaeon]
MAEAVQQRCSFAVPLCLIPAEKINMGVVIVQDGRIRFVNSKFTEISGFERELLIGKRFVELISPEWRPLYEINDDPEYEVEILTRSGERVPAEVSTSLIDFNGAPAEMALVRDISEQRRLEEELFRRQEELIAMTYELEQSNYLKDLFLDIMRHDLLNPIGVAGNFVELLLEEERDADKLELLRAVRRSLTKAVELVENATKFAKLGSKKSLELENLDLRDLVAEVVHDLAPLAEREGMRIENRITESLPVRANRIIAEVFANFISNAIKYAPEGKRIVVEAERGENSVRVKVADFGSGVPDEDKESIFNRFTRRDKKGVKGSGLGLAIAKKIMELHCGRVWVEDNTPRGAVFVAELPAGGA